LVIFFTQYKKYHPFCTVNKPILLGSIVAGPQAIIVLMMAQLTLPFLVVLQ